MSTRSGKRIHAPDQENIDKAEPEVVVKSERKTRSRKVKENDNLEVTVTKNKRNNYVAYPTDDEGIKEASDEPSEEKPLRKLRRYTLKEQNVNVSQVTEDKRRQTRRTKRFADNPENVEPDSVDKVEVPIIKIKNKKNKKKKSNDHEPANHVDQGIIKNEEIPQVIKKSKKKKKGKKKQSNEKPLNKSNTSVDSFHSAAGSPMNISQQNVIIKESTPIQNGFANVETETKVETSSKKRGRKRSTVNDAAENSLKTLDTSFDKDDSDIINDSTMKIKNRKKSSIMNAFADKSLQKSNATFEKDTNSNTTFETEAEPQNKRKRSFVNVTDENVNNTSLKLNITFEKDELNKSKQKRGRKSSIINASDIKLNSTFDKPSNDSKNLNTTFEKTEKTETCSTLDKPKETLNTTFEKKSTDNTVSLNSTYDKEAKINTTFDKNENKSNSRNSLLTSDSSNATFDKTNASRISITSDDSRSENIINQTPVLIESSMDESMEITTDTISTKQTIDVPQLVREGTFTKETTETEPKQLKVSIERTPTKHMSLSSPGCTPFPNRSGQKTEKSILNVTRSLEKGRRSSLVEPRQTRVMFCSPMNNPGLATQQKKKIIKSSMKGSNKSFVFEENGSNQGQTNRPVSRKRSLTLNDADDTRAKRKRLADDLQQSVDRLFRPRTASATAKLGSTEPRKILTPKSKDKSKGRTKLPNFAALHRREFDKMESLTDCQLRKAKRARQLLTPNGGLTVLERTSRGSIESTDSKKEPANEQKITKEPQKKIQEVKPFTPKLPTLESLRPGYTRFGFKMNSDVNPFSFGSQTEIKPRENRPNGSQTDMKPKENRPNGPKIVRAVKPLPSLTGTTSRKEIAKQTILREKSFTSLSSKREMKRTENRTVIKGVRTNRRFELQMQMRNVD